MTITIIPEPPKSRAEAIAWARHVVSQPNAVFLDTETTGLHDTAEIVDLAIVGIDGRVLFDRLVKPTSPIPTEASFIHGISNRDVATARMWDEVWEDVRAIVAGATVVAYNRPFDERMVIQSCKAVNIEPAESTWRCAMRAYTAFLRVPSQPRHDDRWRSLTTAARELGLKEPSHRALADAVACREVVMRIADAVE